MISPEAMLQKILRNRSRLNDDHNGVFWRESLVMAKGRTFTPIPRPKGIRKGTPKLCFNNAFKLVLDELAPDPRIKQHGYRYCEGYCLFDVDGKTAIDIHHGWVVDGKGNAIEVTLSEPALAYFGIPFTKRQFIGVCKVGGGIKPKIVPDGFLHLLMPKAWRKRFENPEAITVAAGKTPGLRLSVPLDQ